MLNSTFGKRLLGRSPTPRPAATVNKSNFWCSKDAFVRSATCLLSTIPRLSPLRLKVWKTFSRLEKTKPKLQTPKIKWQCTFRRQKVSPRLKTSRLTQALIFMKRLSRSWKPTLESKKKKKWPAWLLKCKAIPLDLEWILSQEVHSTFRILNRPIDCYNNAVTEVSASTRTHVAFWRQKTFFCLQEPMNTNKTIDHRTTSKENTYT
mmetsp:Transcript_1186/g.3160  ORF Transcript_1186/g.3160 Transcript_1186/m.3160 type:complete len:206 (-) Transcript_1186:174-791(-)